MCLEKQVFMKNRSPRLKNEDQESRRYDGDLF